MRQSTKAPDLKVAISHEYMILLDYKEWCVRVLMFISQLGESSPYQSFWSNPCDNQTRVNWVNLYLLMEMEMEGKQTDNPQQYGQALFRVSVKCLQQKPTALLPSSLVWVQAPAGQDQWGS